MSTKVRGVKFYLISSPAPDSQMLAERLRLLSQRQRSLLLKAQQAAHLHWFSLPSSAIGEMENQVRGCCSHGKFGSCWRNFEFRALPVLSWACSHFWETVVLAGNIINIILDSKTNSAFYNGEIVSLSAKTVSCRKILKKIVWIVSK